jgi:predicted nucleic acid-binding Zn ribbon protein
VDAVDNSRARPARGGAEPPDPGADLHRGSGGPVHTPGTDGDAVALPPARLGPKGHTLGRRPDTEGSDGDPVESASTGAPRGSDIARAALEAARARHAERGGATPRRTIRRGVPGDGTRRRRRGWSGAGADDRDPQMLGRVASRLSAQRGWAPNLAHGSVFGRWAELVGPEVAEHATPTALRDGELTVQADSTAWATQLRLLQRQLLAGIAAGLGHGVVTKMRIHGPSAPSWRRGPRHVSGRGPRDTYG